MSSSDPLVTYMEAMDERNPWFALSILNGAPGFSANSAFHVVPFDSAYDPNGNMALGTGSGYVAPAPGLYVVCAHVEAVWAGSAVGQAVIGLFVNGNQVRQAQQRGQIGVAQNIGIGVYAQLKLFQGDFVQVKLFLDAGGGTAGATTLNPQPIPNSGTFFDIAWLGYM